MNKNRESRILSAASEYQLPDIGAQSVTRAKGCQRKGVELGNDASYRLTAKMPSVTLMIQYRGRLDMNDSNTLNNAIKLVGESFDQVRA